MTTGSRRFWIGLLTFAFLMASAVGASAQLTRQNWVEKVAFPVSLAGIPKAGTVIDAGNMEQYKNLIPYGVQIFIKKYGFKIWVKDYEPIIPADTYIKATNTYGGQAKLIDIGNEYRKLGIKDYTAGLPFPKVENGLQLGYNFVYSYQGDDSENYYSVYWIDAKKGIERQEDWVWAYINRALYRTDIAPLPEFPNARKESRQYFAYTTCLAPFDKKGFTALYWRFIEPKDQEGYIYIPAQRKNTRFAFGTRGESWNNTDLLYEDVRGYLGYPEWMNWKIVEKKTMLLPMNSGIKYGKEEFKKVYDLENAPHWNFKAYWEPRPVYVVEVTAKFKEYPYSKMIFYMDAETAFIAAKDAYDKKGQMWKVLINAWNKADNPATTPAAIGTALVVDLQQEHATAFGWQKARANIGLTPEKFTLTELRKIGK